ncbi:hypothetical protein EI94DRAFT_1564089, partial [Lactarius quietus]
ILTTLDLHLVCAPSSSPQNFCNIDWDKFRKKLSAQMDLLDPSSCIHAQGELNNTCKKLTEVIQKAINMEVPTINLRIKAKQWWTKELEMLQQEANNKERK